MSEMRINPDVDPRVFHVIRAACAIGSLIVAAAIILHAVRMSRSLRAEGTVKAVHGKAEYDSRGSFNIISVYDYEYEAGGRTIEGTEQTIFPFLYKAGKKLQIHYEEGDPPRVLGSFLFEAGSVMLLILGAVFAFTHAAIRKMGRRRPGPSFHL